VTSKEQAARLSRHPEMNAQVVSYGYTRAKKGFMAMAVVTAAQMALEKAGITIQDVKVIKTHNPFAANDIFMADQMGIELSAMNHYGSSLVFGHPQAPTAGRLIIEGIEELAIRGGGYLLFTGCAAGDTGAALVLKI
jgi:acetyl-CoA acetyltransferase